VFDSTQALRLIEEGSGLDRLIPTEALCQASYREGTLRGVPENRRGFITSPEIVHAAKRRLHLLGYLKDYSRDGALPIAARTAIRRFQTEAHIKVDGWIGERTWSVFEQLFSFEMDARLEDWLGRGTSRVLHRAVQLRLFALGLIPTPPSTQLVEVRPGLERFCALAERLNLSASKLEPSLTALPTLKLLFDQETLTATLARSDPVLVERLAQSVRDEVRRFLVCSAKIELWLMGYDVEPDGTANFKLPAARTGSRGQRERLRSISTGFYYALKRFCDDVNAVTHRRLSARRFYQDFPAIFNEFAAIHEAGGTEDSPAEFGDAIHAALTQNSREAESIWQQRSKSLGGRLWDGMQRAWGWFKRLVGRGLSLLVAGLGNAVRLAWQLARNTLGMVRAALHAFPRSVEFLVHGETAGSNAESIVLRHDGDFDWKVFVAPAPEFEAIAQVLSTFDARVAQFGFCTRLIGLLVQALVISAKYAVTGYFALVLALVQIQKSIQQFLDYYLANKVQLLNA